MVGPLTLGNSVDWNSVRDLPKCSRGIRCLASLKNSRLLVLTWCCSNWDPKLQSIPSEGKGGLLVGGPKNPPTCFFMGSRPWFIPPELTLLHTCLPHLRPFAWVFWWISTILKYTKWSLPPAIFWAVSQTSWIYPKPSMTTGITLPYSITVGGSLSPYIFLHQLHPFALTHHCSIQWRRKLGR